MVTGSLIMFGAVVFGLIAAALAAKSLVVFARRKKKKLLIKNCAANIFAAQFFCAADMPA